MLVVVSRVVVFHTLFLMSWAWSDEGGGVVSVWRAVSTSMSLLMKGPREVTVTSFFTTSAPHGDKANWLGSRLVSSLMWTSISCSGISAGFTALPPTNQPWISDLIMGSIFCSASTLTGTSDLTRTDTCGRLAGPTSSSNSRSPGLLLPKTPSMNDDRTLTRTGLS